MLSFAIQSLRELPGVLVPRSPSLHGKSVKSQFFAAVLVLLSYHSGLVHCHKLQFFCLNTSLLLLLLLFLLFLFVFFGTLHLLWRLVSGLISKLFRTAYGICILCLLILLYNIHVISFLNTTHNQKKINKANVVIYMTKTKSVFGSRLNFKR